MTEPVFAYEQPSVRFTVYGSAQPKGSARALVPKGWNRAVVTSANPKLKGWEQTVRERLTQVLADTPRGDVEALFEGPVLVSMEFHLPRPKSLPKRVTLHTKKPDVDKLARGTVDALNGVLFRDDSQVVEVRARKVYAETCAKVVIRVERMVG